MYCTHCGKHNPEDSKFCQHCGLKLDEPLTIDKPPYPYVISITKLVSLSIATFGLYDIYWFYKQKKSFYSENNEKHGTFYILLDSVFAGLTSYNLFKQVSNAEKSIGNHKRGLEAGAWAVTYFILLSLWRLPGNLWWFSMCSVIPLIFAQNSINHYWNKKYGENIIKSKFGLGNWLWSIVGGSVVLLAFIGTLMPSTSNTTTNSFGSQNTSTNTQLQTTQKQTYDISQAVIDIACDNNQGGSGTILTTSGTILTNNHVILGAKSCLITLPDTSTGAPKEIYTAEPTIIPNLSKQYDLAFLRIKGAYTDNNGKTWGTYPTNFPAYTAPSGCDKYVPKLGDSVRIYGYPVTSGGYNLTITDGIISSFTDNNDILTSSKIDSGNSGGLAVNKDQCFVGVPSAVVAGNYQNLGVIIPSSVISDFTNNIESSYQSSTTESNANQSFDISCLILKNAQMFGNSYYSANPTYIASLYNGCSQPVKNVAIKVNFFTPNANSDSIPSDTEYVNLGIDYLAPGDAHAINGTINTSFDTSGNFKWTAQVYSADPD